MSGPEIRPVTVPLMRLDNSAGLALPAYATSRSAGVDLLAAINDTIILVPAARVLVPTGIAIALPAACEAQVRPRSGLAARHGVTVLNSPGTIDADYRGEIGVILINHGSESFEITRGMRIAQMVIAPVQVARWDVRDLLEPSDRGACGFGSTGTDGDIRPEARE